VNDFESFEDYSKMHPYDTSKYLHVQILKILQKFLEKILLKLQKFSKKPQKYMISIKSPRKRLPLIVNLHIEYASPRFWGGSFEQSGQLSSHW